eukprot:TRINITY_DN3280_c0_g1_i3.p3 TRINITY_DN3280_c0_g1~~TRINITY_DN3280_c0_g1_i3.p3  ORF type:complete len:112 (-),score=1.48 TRINITY_DN3280_c0_g1_i3:158-493(-)
MRSSYGIILIGSILMAFVLWSLLRPVYWLVYAQYINPFLSHGELEETGGMRHPLKFYLNNEGSFFQQIISGKSIGELDQLCIFMKNDSNRSSSPIRISRHHSFLIQFIQKW